MGAPGAGDPVFPLLGNGGYDVERYVLDFDVTPAQNRLRAVAMIKARATQRLRAFDLDYNGPPIERTSVDGRRAGFCRRQRKLIVVPARPLREGARLTVEVSYAGSPKPVYREGAPAEEGWIELEGQIAAFGVWGASAGWYPLNDTNTDKALYTLRVTVPKPLVVTATGRLEHTIEEGPRTTYVWQSDVPVGPGRAGLSIDEYRRETLALADGRTLDNYAPARSPADALAELRVVPAMVEYLSGLFGPFPYDSFGYTLLRNPIAPFAASAQARTFLPGPIGEELLAHHLARQWFSSNASAATAADDWLSQAPVVYAELIWGEHRYGRSDLERRVRGLHESIGPRTRAPVIVDAPADLGDEDVATRGALLFHALRLELGDEMFFRFLRTYLERFRYSAVRTGEFVGLAEEVSDRDLDAFFDAWLYEERVPPLPRAKAPA